MKISIIGSGYVGLVTGACFSEIGHNVICVENNMGRIKTINNFKAPFFEPSLDKLLERNIKKNRLKVTSNLEKAILNTNITFICVGTPSKNNGDIDLSYVKNVTEHISSILKKKKTKQLIVIKSTVLPGTTESFIEKILEQNSNNYYIASNPEFLRQGSAVNDFMTPDRIVIGYKEKNVKKIFTEVYYKYKKKLFFTTIANSELIKYTSNYFLSTLISFSNEISNICDQIIHTNVEEILKCLHLDRRLNFISENNKSVFPKIIDYIKAGGGYGGSCLPKDTKALEGFAKKKSIKVPLLKSVISINNERAKILSNKIKGILNNYSLNKVTVVGVTFKQGTDDLRDSPAIELIKELLKLKLKINIFDNFVKQTTFDKTLKRCKIVKDLEVSIKDTGCVIIGTETKIFNKLKFNHHRKIILFDTRNCIKESKLTDSFILFSVGKKITNYPNI